MIAPGALFVATAGNHGREVDLRPAGLAALLLEKPSRGHRGARRRHARRLRDSDLDRAADLAARNPYPNPTPITRERLRALLDDAFHGRPPAR